MSDTIDDLRRYLHRRLRYLDQCRAEIEAKIRDEEREFLNNVDAGNYDDGETVIGQVVHHLEILVGNTFRYTMLVGVCSFLEEAMSEIMKHALKDYTSRLARQRGGNWLQKHLRLLSESSDLDLDLIGDDISKFNDVITIRNCIVHSWGHVDKCRHPNAMRQSMARIPSVQETVDGCLYLDDQAYAEAACAAENIVDCILPLVRNVSLREE